jgi:hypothetical protein
LQTIFFILFVCNGLAFEFPKQFISPYILSQRYVNENCQSWSKCGAGIKSSFTASRHRNKNRKVWSVSMAEQQLTDSIVQLVVQNPLQDIVAMLLLKFAIDALREGVSLPVALSAGPAYFEIILILVLF